MKRPASWCALGAAVALACRPIEHEPSPTPAANDCPTHSCVAYVGASGKVDCAAGACIDSVRWSDDLVIVVDVPVGAVTVPGHSCAMRLGDLLAELGPLPAGACTSSACTVRMPAAAAVSGNYTVLKSETDAIRATLITRTETTLPVHVTYRALWPPDANSAANDAFAAGLDIFPFQASQSNSVSGFPGPDNGPPEGFQVHTQSKINYERTIAPDSPFDEDIPPDVEIVSEPGPSDLVTSSDFDKTGPITNQSFPQYNLSRAQAPMDGWKAYLRDGTTKRPISPIKTLSGNLVSGLILATHYHPPSGDALTTARLVIAPSDPSLPTEASPFAFISDQTYPDLPPPKEVDGTIQWTGEAPPAADVIFEAQKIYVGFDAAAGQGSQSDGGPSDDAGGSVTTFQAQPNFEFTTDVTVRPDASGVWTFSTQIPRGIYRVIVRPADGGEANPTIVNAVTILDDVETLDGTEVNADLPLTIIPEVASAAVVHGTARIADGRALSGAIVEAMPIACPPTTSDSGNVPTDTVRCLPRYAETFTDDLGHFMLKLDPGDYVLRAEPPEGSRLPWAWQTISISPGTSDQLEDLTVPAPAQLQMQLIDPGSNRFLTNAVVHVYTPPTATQKAVEIARSVTDGSGTFDVYLAPSIQ